MTSSDLWSKETAENYDADEVDNSTPEVIDPIVDFLADLAGDGRALEFAIGTGRVGVPLRQRGVPVAGIEYSAPMAEVLHRKIDADTLPVTVGDMATTQVDGEFAVVYLVYNTIGNLRTQDEQVACFANAARHLAPGGRFVIEVGVPVLRRMPPGQVIAPFEVSEQHLGFDTYNLVTQEAVSHHYSRREDGTYGYSPHNYRYVWPSELDLMARLAGMTLERRIADWNGAPFTNESTKHISVWRKDSQQN